MSGANEMPQLTYSFKKENYLFEIACSHNCNNSNCTRCEILQELKENINKTYIQYYLCLNYKNHQIEV